MKTLQDYIIEVRGKMYKEGLTTFKLSQIIGCRTDTLTSLFYKIPKEKGKLVTFVKLLNYLEDEKNQVKNH